MENHEHPAETRRFLLSLEPEYLERLNETAKALKVSRTTVVKEALLQYMAQFAPDLCREFVELS